MTFPHLIGITGYKRSGKDSVAHVLIERYGYTRIAFADTLKEMALDINPVILVEDHELLGNDEAWYRIMAAPSWSPATRTILLADLVEAVGWEIAKEHHEVRRFLQRLGTEGVRNHLGDDAWLRAWHRRAQPIDYSTDGAHPKIVVPDVRFANEANHLRLAGGTIWRVERPGTEPDGHASETELDTIQADMIIHNSGPLAQLDDLIRIHFEGITLGESNRD